MLLDQSLGLLRKGKSRLTKRKGKVPGNMIFLHGDARQLPFKAGALFTIISLNLLHYVDDIETVLVVMYRVLKREGTAALTTLVRRGDRWSDGYLSMLALSGAVVARSPDQIMTTLHDVGMPVKQEVKGNLAFITCR